MISLYDHQKEGIDFLVQRQSAGLFFSMGLGKTRCALLAAQQLFKTHKIDRVLVLAPAAVRISWREEIDKLDLQGVKFVPCIYEPKKQTMYGAKAAERGMLPVALISYALLPQERHVKAFSQWCLIGKTLLVCDESSFLKSRTAKQTKGAMTVSKCCGYCWLLTGTPIANSPLDLYSQALVMSPVNGNGHNYKPNAAGGPLKGFGNFYHFRSRYAVLKMVNMGQLRFQQVVGYQHLDELTEKFRPYVLRRTKEECLDLPAKTYVTREVMLSEATWKVYQELKRDALLSLPDEDVRPEPNAAVRILRLCQLTSGHVGNVQGDVYNDDGIPDGAPNLTRDVSSEKLDFLVEELLDGELSSQVATIVWCRWRRERERLQQLLATKLEVYGVFGGQQTKNRSESVQGFQISTARRVLIAQQHAGGFGLNLTAASTAVYLSNSFSFTDRIQSEDRQHRIGQKNPCTYIDVLAVGPKGQKTVDHHVLECLRNKKNLAETTCSAWKRILNE